MVCLNASDRALAIFGRRPFKLPMGLGLGGGGECWEEKSLMLNEKKKDLAKASPAAAVLLCLCFHLMR